jgi:hypothetical protein
MLHPVTSRNIEEGRTQGKVFAYPAAGAPGKDNGH